MYESHSLWCQRVGCQLLFAGGLCKHWCTSTESVALTHQHTAIAVAVLLLSAPSANVLGVELVFRLVCIVVVPQLEEFPLVAEKLDAN